MATIAISDELHAIIEREVKVGGYTDLQEYLARIVRQEQKRRAKEEFEAFVLEGVESGDPVEMTSESWQNLRRELHRHTDAK